MLEFLFFWARTSAIPRATKWDSTLYCQYGNLSYLWVKSVHSRPFCSVAYKLKLVYNRPRHLSTLMSSHQLNSRRKHLPSFPFLLFVLSSSGASFLRKYDPRLKMSNQIHPCWPLIEHLQIFFPTSTERPISASFFLHIYLYIYACVCIYVRPAQNIWSPFSLGSVNVSSLANPLILRGAFFFIL